MHRLPKRQGWEIGRGQTGRLMRSLGLRGIKRGKRVFTTESDPVGSGPTVLAQRRFRTDAPRRLWVVDVTYVCTWQGFAYVAFITHAYSRRIVGWNVAATLKADILPLQALEMAAFDTGGNLTGLTHHSDHGSNYMAMVYTDRVMELGAVASISTDGDSYDNAMAEVISALHKAEILRTWGPWRTVEQVELATLECVWWWNNQRLHSELDYRTPFEAEHEYCADTESLLKATAPQENT